MSSGSLKHRSLLTDTLPYEVPVIFSNSILHASLSAPHLDAKVAAAVALLRKRHRPYSKPYSYDIVKGLERATTLGVIHPAWQIAISQFYEDHAASILTYCADERFSLRRPAAVASPYTEERLDDSEGRLKLGVAQLASDAGAPDVSHLTTYFAYRKYNLLGKFADSREHQRLEMRFNYRRALDVSKCFYNIYTHSVTWAIKGKDFSKQHANSYTFEGQLDSLFQKINYNETNGIVVGPEFSRIFAEIILQQIDRDIVNGLLNAVDGSKFEVTKDYDIRRYVDDYYIFSNSLEVLDAVEGALANSLERYKLYLNTSKRETHSRPFVSDISLARYEINALVREISRSLREINTDTPSSRVSGILRTIRSLLADVRLAIRAHGVRFENVSGWLLGKYRVITGSILRKAKEVPELRSAISDAVIALVDASLYVCAVDTRVRTTYSLCQLLELIDENRDILPSNQLDQVEHSINDGVVGILRTLWTNKSRRGKDNVEMYNLLIAGSKLLKTEFIDQTLVSEILSDLARAKPTYFRYISVKFCLLADATKYQNLMDELNNNAEEYLRTASDWQMNSEDFLLLSDFFSAPDISSGRKRQLFADLVGTNPSKATIEAMTDHVGFVDWSGLSVKHLLRRKTLRPVYAWG